MTEQNKTQIWLDGKRIKVAPEQVDTKKLREQLKTYLKSHTIQEVSSEMGITQILSIIQPLIELAKKQIREEMYKQLREVEDGLIVRAKQEVIGEIKTDVNYEQLEARRLCGEAIADTDNPNKYPNAQYHLGYEHACRNIIESIKSRYLGNKGGGE